MLCVLIAVAAAQVAPAAEQVASAALEAPVPTPNQRIVKALTAVELEFADAASSKTSKSGDLIHLRTSADVHGPIGEILIPSSLAIAEVIQASPGRIMGKAGELTLAARHIEVGQQKIPLKRFGFGRNSGKDNIGATFIATAVIGLPGLLISGGNVEIAAGASANAVVASNTELAGPAPADNSPQGGK
jgi:hypothetical protein